MQHRDCILILGSGVSPEGTLSLIGKSRVEKGVALYKKGLAARVLFCGGYSYKMSIPPRKTEAVAMKEYAISLGVASMHCYVEEQSRDTLGNAYFAKQFLEKQNWFSLFVVTSHIYLPKTEYAFKKVFGREFSFELVPCLTYLSTEELLERVDSEKEKMHLYKDLLDGVLDGDDRAVRKALQGLPWYAQLLRMTVLFSS